MVNKLTKTPVPILHIASHNINVGDGALISSIHRRLKYIAGIPLKFKAFDIVDFEPEYGGATLAQVDFAGHALTLIGGGGTIDSKRNRTTSGMAFPMSGQDIRQCKSPLAYVAIGYNLFGDQYLRNKEALIAVLNACADKGFPFSVRNDGSLERLQEAVGVAAEHVIEVPDPGFFIQIDDTHHAPQITPKRPRIIIQLAADNAAQRFSFYRNDLLNRAMNKLPFIDTSEHLTTVLSNLVVWFVQEYDAEIILAPHIATDIQLTADILRKLPTCIARKNARVLGIPSPLNADRFFAAYKQADLVIGMRGHSVICAVGLGVPCVALSTHPKVSGFMEKSGVADWSVAYSRDCFGELRTMSQQLLEDSQEYHRRRDEATKDFAERFDGFMQLCWQQTGL